MPVQMPILLGDLYCICVGVLPPVGGMDARLATTAAANNPPQLAPLASPLARGYVRAAPRVVLFALTIPMRGWPAARRWRRTAAQLLALGPRGGGGLVLGVTYLLAVSRRLAGAGGLALAGA